MQFFSCIIHDCAAAGPACVITLFRRFGTNQLTTSSCMHPCGLHIPLYRQSLPSAMKITNLALLSFLAAVFLSVVPATDAASVYGGYPAADAADDEVGLATNTLNQTPNAEIEGGDDISVLRKGGGGGGGGGGVVGGVGGGRSSKRCKSGKTQKTLSCGDDVFGKVRLTEGLNCPSLADGDTAITVKEGATLDCGGNTIFGPDSPVGIKVEEGGTVRNCKLTSFRDGISSTGPSTITNCVISDVKNALFYNPSTSSPKDKYEAKNVYITNSKFGIFISPNGYTNKFKFDSVTMANPDTSGLEYYGIYVAGNISGSSLTFNKITSAADAVFDYVEGSGTIKIKSSIFDGGGVVHNESGSTNDIKLSIEKTLVINAPGDGLTYTPASSSSSTLDVSDSSIVLSGEDGVDVYGATATLDSVELSGNGFDGLYNNNAADVTANNILAQFNGFYGIFSNPDASANVNDSKVCRNVGEDIGGSGSPPALNNVVCEKAGSGSGVTCPNQSGNCTAAEEVATTSCV